ncbi:hypothetical protein [Candidatus Stoquefichus massiliensis]|uniref:hypothetical protein n=1 Tax=Candidatus Stoquefichus massiliensis TaxID=1470350 RepID=UPI00047F3208|nr:hypothetical protein [Candidatus Stoquefichus massiliensis]
MKAKFGLFILTIFILSGCTLQKWQRDFQIQNTNTEKRVLIITHNLYGSQSILTEYISQKIFADIVNLQAIESIDIHHYDIILINDTPINDEPTKEMVTFLQQYDFINQRVSTYWIGAMSNQTYETNLKKYISSSCIINGLGFNDDEISEKELIDEFIERWINSLFN